MASLDLYPPAVDFPRPAACQRQPRYCCDTGERLAPETKTCYILQVLKRGDLAGRVSRKCKSHLISGNSRSIVGDTDQSGSTLEKLRRYFRRAGINTILQYLLKRGRGTLYHFSSGNLADEQLG